jgi:3-methyladenine DNA glycosylase AlkD
MAKLRQVKRALREYARPEKVPDYLWFFKTGKGEYGEGDKFLGIRMPDIRKVVKDFRFELSDNDIEKLIYSKYHEERMFSLLYLVALYKSKRTEEAGRERIFKFYISHVAQINNWDLVDVTCPHIVGAHLLDKNRDILYQFAKSDNLWKKRIAIISTFPFINVSDYKDTLKIAKILLNDEHDLIHKAVGWSLRNIGNMDLETELRFLKPRYKKMPRTMLRYAIEKFDEPLRQQFLKGDY